MRSDRDFADEFDAAFAGLKGRVDAACAAEAEWAAGIAAGIAAALEFAAEDPAAVQTLISDAFAYGAYGALRYRHMARHFACQLEGGRDQRAEAASLPSVTEEATIGGIAEVVAERLRAGAGETLPGLSGQLIELTLTPYLGPEAAKELAGRER